jgi:hypothetical protein
MSCYLTVEAVSKRMGLGLKKEKFSTDITLILLLTVKQRVGFFFFFVILLRNLEIDLPRSAIQYPNTIANSRN